MPIILYPIHLYIHLLHPINLIYPICFLWFLMIFHRLSSNLSMLDTKSCLSEASFQALRRGLEGRAARVKPQLWKASPVVRYQTWCISYVYRNHISHISCFCIEIIYIYILYIKYTYTYRYINVRSTGPILYWAMFDGSPAWTKVTKSQWVEVGGLVAIKCPCKQNHTSLKTNIDTNICHF